MSILISNERARDLDVAVEQLHNLESVRRTHASRALRSIPAAALGVDLIAIAATLFLASLGRREVWFFAPSSADYAPQVATAAPLIAFAWLGSIAVFGGYETRFFGAGV